MTQPHFTGMGSLSQAQLRQGNLRENRPPNLGQIKKLDTQKTPKENDDMDYQKVFPQNWK
jgi:hypothetical protein